MDRTSLDQAVEMVVRAQRGILLAVPVDPSPDALAAMLGLSLGLERLGKSTTMVSASFVPEPLRFLPGTSQVRERVEAPAEVVLDVPLHGARAHDVRWDAADDHVRITMRVSPGLDLTNQNLRMQRASPWDLLLAVGASRVQDLGALFAGSSPSPADIPLLNLDAGTVNEFFGTVNLVSSTSSTVSEVALELLETLGRQTLTPEVATCLLAGIAAATDSFRTPRLTPRTFQAASRLLQQDADHQTVVRHLFRTHSLPELRLLGRALARLEDGPRETVVAVLHERDFTETDATSDMTPGLLKEMTEWAGRARTVLLAFERTPGTFEVLVSLGTTNPQNRETFRARTGGVAVGPFVLVNLGSVAPERLPETIRERLTERLPQPEDATRVRTGVEGPASGIAEGVSASRRG